MLAPGSSFSTIGRMVAAPSTSVSSRPRRLRMRSVKTWPRSRSAASWISSTATKATSRSRGIASTVETQKRGLGGLIFSSPVISATASVADSIDDLVVDLARQQPQRQADNAGRMRQHPLDGEMGLAGIGRPENGGDARATGTGVPVRGRRLSDGHRWSDCGLKTCACPCAWRGERWEPKPHKALARSFCITMRRCGCLWLSCGTSLERITAESRTHGLFGFVHCDIWGA